ncbi:MAG TPA: GNAT family N-acetyltransferase [Gaiellales bacterium]|nr:GNAT family N-acetyltransferase [Gaiellales bacterium]
MRIRLAEPADAPAVDRLTREAYSVYVPVIGREPAPMAADHAALIDAGEVHVAEVDGRVAGALVTRPLGRSLLLESVAVDPASQGRGIGRALIACAERQAAGLGLEAVELYTNAAMTANLALYPHLGYVETGRRTEDGYDRVFFRKPISAPG